MATNDRRSLTGATARLRALADRLKRSVMARRPAVRWSAALLALVVLTSLVYWAATSLGTVGVRQVLSGRRFSSEDLIKICRSLDKQKIANHVDAERRVEVAADQYDQAADVVAKLDLGDHSIDEILDESTATSWLEGPKEREARVQRSQNKFIEKLIGQLDGVVSSIVSINRPQTAKFSRTAPKHTAFVYIETEGNRPLPYQTVQSIPVILAGIDPELTPASITVMDRRGARYFDPGNPGIGDKSRNEARERELSDEILEKLEWIKGVRVQVKLYAPRTPLPALPVASSAQVARPSVAPDRMAGQSESGSPSPHSGAATPAIRLNQPFGELDPLPKPPAVVGTGTDTAAATAHTESRDQPQKQEPGRVFIYVPRSFYFNAANIRTDNREPTQDELRSMEDRTENQIRTAVSLAMPDGESWKVGITTFPDELPLSRPTILQSSADARRRVVMDWGIVGTVGAIVSIVAAVGSWIQVARRPTRLPEPTVKTRRYHVDSASEPGPSERVRELVRNNPEAAASVLERWTRQGGRAL
jgi:flagellar M-ring protein FliF